MPLCQVRVDRAGEAWGCERTDEPGNRRAGESENRGIGESENRGIGESEVFSKFTNGEELYLEGNMVVIKTNGVPDHSSPYFSTTDSRYAAYDGDNANFQLNPNRISEQDFTFRIPVNPQEATNKPATPLGPIGVAINGVAIFNQYAGPNQPLTREIDTFDQFSGHPQQTGVYHYHVEPLYLTVTNGKETLVGFLLDGFPVYGPVENGELVTNAHLHRAGGMLYYAGVPFSGRLVAPYEGGAIKSTTPYLDGRAHGLAKGWYPGGAQQFVRWYQFGKKEATHVGWWDHGATQFVYHFQNGLHEGNAKQWYPNGLLYRDFNYENGQEADAQRMWYEDGTLRANYVVKDGRRYGLIGSKPCSNPTS